MPGELDRRKQLKPIILFISIVCICRADESQRAPFLLPPAKTTRILQLLAERNFSLEFVFQQQLQTDSILLRVVGSHNTRIFEVASSTVYNYITLTFKISSGFLKIYKIHAPLNDGLFHRVIVTLGGGELRVVDNCRIIFNDTDNELINGTPTHSARIYFANDPNVTSKEIWFHGNIQEFSVVVGDLIANRCIANLEMIIDNPVLKETVTHEENTETIAPSDADTMLSIYSSNSVLNENSIGITSGPVLNSDQEISYDLTTLHERISYLQHQMNHWNTIYDKFEMRVKQMELYLRGCNMNGLMLKSGERHRDPVTCTECQCSASGTLYCGAIGCPKLDCLHPVRAPGKCCPECGKQCYFNGNLYDNAVEFRPKRCVKCICTDGNMLCQHMPTDCPVLECLDQVMPSNECCPICRNVNYCDDQHNRCHVNATCQSDEYSATCKCKTGFFGNGSSCYDIDECLWDEDARQQLSGCQTGTICINLPGSFKCDCLPGFQKLDERTCLNIIRI